VRAGWDRTHLISKQLRFLYHHPHFGAGVRDAFDFEGAVVPLGEEAVGLFEFTPEEEGFCGGGVFGSHFGWWYEGSSGVRVCGMERSRVLLLGSIH
jgi:hypothetical protein